MSDRLKDLLHQRALAQEQLAWLDREIARETGDNATTPAVPVRPAPRLATGVSRPPALSTRSADEIIAQYQAQGRSPQETVKRGCFTVFFAAFAVLGLVLAAFWYFKYRS